MDWQQIMSSVSGPRAVSASEHVQGLRVPPQRPWQSQRGSEPALSYQAVMQLDIGRASELGIVGPRLALLDRAHAGSTRVGALHGDRRVRISSIGRGAFGDDYVHIRDDTQEGFLYLCPSLRGYLHLPRPGAAPVAAATAAARAGAARQPPVEFTIPGVDTSDTAVVASRTCQAVTLRAAAPFAIRWRLWLCGDADLSPFALPAATVLTGAPPAVAEVVAGWGLPLRGELGFGDSGAFPEPASSFRLEELVLRTATDSEFNVPAGYADLRSTSKEAP